MCKASVKSLSINKPAISFLQTGSLSCCPTNSVKAGKNSSVCPNKKSKHLARPFLMVHSCLASFVTLFLQPVKFYCFCLHYPAMLLYISTLEQTVDHFTILPVGMCFASLTTAKLPLPMVFMTRYLPMCCTGSGRLALVDLVCPLLPPLDDCQTEHKTRQHLHMLQVTL